MTKPLSTLTFITAVACLAAAIPAQAHSLTDARATGRGGTGLALSTPHTALLNPANAMGEPDTLFAVYFGVGAHAQDPGDIIDNIDDTQDNIDNLQSFINYQVNRFNRLKDQADNLKQRADSGTLKNSTFYLGGESFHVDSSGNINGQPAKAFLAHKKQQYQQKLDDKKQQAQTKIDTVVDDLSAMSDEPITVDFASAFLITVPTDSLGVSIFAKAHGKLSGVFHFDDADKTIMENAKDTAYFDKDQLQSYVQTSAYGIANYGINLASNISFGVGTLDYGVALKEQKIYLANKRVTVSSSGDDAFDRDKDLHESDFKINADLGATLHLTGTGFSVAAVLHNVRSRSVKLPDQNLTYHVKPQLTVGGAWDIGWFKTEVDLDTTKTQGFGMILPTQKLRIGAQVGTPYIAQFRVGYITDLQNNEDPVYTVGFGISPFNTVSLDLAGMIGHDKNYGVMLTLGINI